MLIKIELIPIHKKRIQNDYLNKMNNLIKIDGLSKIEIIKYLYIQLKHIYPEKTQFYLKIFYLPNEIIMYIFDYLKSNQICSIGKIIYLHFYNKNLILKNFYIEYMNYFNEEWNLFVDIKLKQKYINLYNKFLSFSKNIYNFDKYIYKKVNKQQRTKIKNILEKCDCCYEHRNKYLCDYCNYDYYEYDINYLKCRCPCKKIIEVIDSIEEDLYFQKIDKEYYEKYKINNNQNENKYIKISKLLSNKSCDNLSIDELNENDWIYYDSMEHNKVQ